MNRARKDLFGCTAPLKLSSHIHIPPSLDEGVYKCRLLYKEQIEHIEFIPYRVRAIHTLKLVYCDSIEYSYKFENREMIDALLKQRGAYDDILIVKKGFITDTSYCNIIFFDGTHWVTPAIPLLRGTQREKLLAEKTIHEQHISVDDLNKFISAQLINALLDFEGPVIPISQIK